MTRVAEQQLVRAFLADRDFYCPCGYNLRGLAGPKCPECARHIRIPEDPALFEMARQQQLVEFLRTRDVRCKHCRYNLRGASSNRCPECGATYMLAGGSVAWPRTPGRRPRRQHSALQFQSRLLLIAIAAWAIAVLIMLSVAVVQRDVIQGVRPALLVAATPTLLLLIWRLTLAPIRRMSGPICWILGQAAVLVSLASIGYSLWLLAP